MPEIRQKPLPGELSERDLRILGAIIQDYIASPEPVGSCSLARNHSLDISSATVRNIMGDLEALGYLTKPHTSAGRIPTTQAFRLFVDSFLRVRPLRRHERDRIDRGYDPPADEVSSLMLQTSKILHRLTHHAAVVATPKISQTTLKHISFVRLRQNRILAVLVTNSGVVQNKALTVDFSVTQDDLDKMTRYLETLIGDKGDSLKQIRSRLAEIVEEDKVSYDQMLLRAMELGQQALSDLDEARDQDVLITGESSFFELPEFADREKVRALLDSLQEKKTLLRILEHAEDSPGIQIFVGAGSGLSFHNDLSLVLANYNGGDRILGTIGVIGPTRMDYSRVIPYVEYTAEILDRIFSGEHS